MHHPNQNIGWLIEWDFYDPLLRVSIYFLGVSYYGFNNSYRDNGISEVRSVNLEEINSLSNSIDTSMRLLSFILDSVIHHSSWSKVTDTHSIQ